MAYLYILGTILFTVYGQLIIKWRIGIYGDLPALVADKIIFLFKVLFDPWIFSGFASAFIASFFWMATMTKLDLSHAYPFMGLSFVLVLFFSIFFLGEHLNLYKALGTGLIVLGIVIVSKGI